jgi:hypothetical protein
MTAVADTPTPATAHAPPRRGAATAALAWVIALAALGGLIVAIAGWHIGPTVSIARNGIELGASAASARDVEQRGDGIAVSTPDNRVVVLALGVPPFAAADAGVVTIDGQPIPRDAELALLWVRKTDPGVIHEQRLNEEDGYPQPTLLDRSPEWRGEIAWVALGVKRAPQVLVVIRRVRLESVTPRAVAADLWRGWMHFNPWDGRSINVAFGGREEQRLFLVPLAFGAAALAVAFLVLRARRRRVPLSRAWVVVPFVLSWLLLDARWQAHLVHQARDTHALFGGKTLDERHMLMDDAALYRFIQDNRAKLPAEPARIFVTSDLDYFRLRGGYHLYPHNVLAFDWADPGILRPGDYLLLFQKADVRFDAARGELEWPGDRRVRVEALAAGTGQGLFRVR